MVMRPSSGVGRSVLGGLWGQFHIERSGRMSGQDDAFLGWSGILASGSEEAQWRGAKTEGRPQTHEGYRSGDSFWFFILLRCDHSELHGLPSHGDK